MSCEQIHETVIRDIVDVVMDVKNSTNIAGFKDKKSIKSIAKQSSKLTAVFPVIVSRSVNIENAAMVTKALERRFVTMFEVLFSAMSVTNAKDGVDYLSRFHTNISLGDPNVDTMIDALDKYIDLDENAITNITVNRLLAEDKRNLDYVLPDSINEHSLNSYKIFGSKYANSTTIMNEARDPDDILKNIATAQKAFSDMNKNTLLDSDVKKANELVPTLMSVNMILDCDDNGLPIYTTMIVGVKAKMYPIDSEDIMNRLSLKVSDKNGLLKFIRATTREISFAKDFLFAIDKAKIDALSQSKRGSSSKFWKVLERRALKSKIRRSLGQINDATCITSIVITQEEVEYLKKTNNIDLEQPYVIRQIMESYNLISFVIIDEAMEVCKFIFDSGDDTYETITFNHLERETGSSETKKMINIMSKMAR